jgi:hypothetical protein
MQLMLIDENRCIQTYLHITFMCLNTLNITLGIFKIFCQRRFGTCYCCIGMKIERYKKLCWGEFVSIEARCTTLKLKLELNYDRQWVGKSVLASGSHLEPMTRLLFSVWQLRSSCCRASSLTRGWACNLPIQFLLRLARAVTLGSKSSRTNDHILLYQLRLSQPGGPGPCIYIPRNRVAQLYPRTLDSLFVTSYDSQGYGGGILTRLHRS